MMTKIAPPLLIAIALLTATHARPSAQAGNITFGPPAIYATGAETFVKLGDLNADGRPDIVTANGGTQDASVLIGQADGTFGAAVNYFTNAIFGRDVALADFNKDGKQDIVLVSVGAVTPEHLGEEAAIMLGNGTGGFSSLTNINIGAYAHTVETGDFDGDGDQDFVAGLLEHWLSIWLGDGAGGFDNGGTVDLPVLQPVGMVAADLDLDGDLDLAVANQTDDSVTVLLNDGAAGFASMTTIAAQDGTSFVIAGDFNGDGLPDLAASNQNIGSVTILIGNGSGAVWAASHYPAGGGTGLATGDLDGDGDLDLVTGHQPTDVMIVLQGDGAGAFTPIGTFPAGDGGPTTFAIADLNGDGKSDVVAGNRFASQVAVLMNTSAAAPPPPPPPPAICGPGTFSATGSEPCTPAPGGTFVSSSGSTSPTPCPEGTFSNTSGSASCTPCPIGMTSPPGSTACVPMTPDQATQELIADITAIELHGAGKAIYDALLSGASRALDRGDLEQACRSYDQVIRQTQLQEKTEKLRPSDAALIIAGAEQAKIVTGCP